MQELICEGADIVLELHKFFTNWEFEFVDAKCRSGGLIVGWNCKHMKLQVAWALDYGIGVNMFLVVLGIEFLSVNIMVLTTIR